MRLLCVCPVIVGVLGLVGCGDEQPARPRVRGTQRREPSPSRCTRRITRGATARRPLRRQRRPLRCRAAPARGDAGDDQDQPRRGESNPAHIHDVTWPSTGHGQLPPVAGDGRGRSRDRPADGGDGRDAPPEVTVDAGLLSSAQPSRWERRRLDSGAMNDESRPVRAALEKVETPGTRPPEDAPSRQ